MSKRKTRVQWARHIRAIHKQTVKQTVQGIFKMGRTLIAAKAALDYGEFEKMIASNLPFDASTAQRLMKIARDPRLQKSCTVQVLPIAWGTLYELTKLSDAAFEQAMASGAINQQTTRDDVVNMRPSYTPGALRGAVHDTSEAPLNIIGRETAEPSPTITLVARPRPIEHEQAPLTTLPTSKWTLYRIEQLVGELQAEIERGEAVVDAAFSLSAHSIAEQLLAMAARYGKLVHH